jgi:hypothetical protein
MIGSLRLEPRPRPCQGRLDFHIFSAQSLMLLSCFHLARTVGTSQKPNKQVSRFPMEFNLLATFLAQRFIVDRGVRAKTPEGVGNAPSLTKLISAG